MSIKYLTNIEVIGLAGTLLQILCQTSLINPLKAFVLIVILLCSINKKKYIFGIRNIPFLSTIMSSEIRHGVYKNFSDFSTLNSLTRGQLQLNRTTYPALYKVARLKVSIL